MKDKSRIPKVEETFAALSKRVRKDWQTLNPPRMVEEQYQRIYIKLGKF